MEKKKASDTAQTKEKFDRVRSPEELDAYIRVVRPGTLLLIGAFTLITVALIVWGITGSLPVNVAAKGVLYTDFARLTSQATSEGRLEEFRDEAASYSEEDFETLAQSHVYCFLNAYQYNLSDLEGKTATVTYPGKTPIQGKVAWVEATPATKGTITTEFGTSFIADACATSDYSWVVAIDTEEPINSEIRSLMDVSIEIGQVKPISMLFQ